MNNGTWYCFGRGFFGQLGLNDNFDRYTSTPFTGLSQITQVSVGFEHSVMLKDGFVYTFGNGGLGRLGTGNDQARNIPTRLDSLSNIVFIAAGSDFTYAVASNGSAYSFGRNHFGQLGTADSTDRSSPTPVNIVKPIREVSAGFAHALFLTDDNLVFAVGKNNFGQLGLGHILSPITTPQQTSLNLIAKIYAGVDYSFVLGINSTLFAFGANGNGQLGNGQFVHVSSPSMIMNDVAKVAIGTSTTNVYSASLILLKNSTLLVCGLGTGGAHGILPYQRTRPVPNQVPTLENVTDIAAGEQTAFAITVDNGKSNLWTWGTASFGENGLGLMNVHPPRRSSISLRGSSIIVAGSSSSHLKSNNTIFGVGENRNGRLGVGDTDIRTSWTDVKALDGQNIVDIHVGEVHTLYLTSQGDVYSSGGGLNGQLCLGNFLDQNSPQKISLSSISKIATGGYHSFFHTNTSITYICGQGSLGQLGYGGFGGRNIPTMLSLGSVTHFVGAQSSSYVAVANGTLYSFGSNGNGQLGLGYTGGSVPTPTLVNSINSTQIAQITAGNSYYLLLMKNSTIFAVGSGFKGQFCDGKYGSYFRPTQIPIPFVITSMASLETTNLFLTNDSLIYGCGSNSHGQLGLPVMTDYPSATQVPEARGVVQISAGYFHSAFISVPICFGVISTSKSVCSSNGECIDDEICSCRSPFIGSNCQFISLHWSGKSVTNPSLMTDISNWKVYENGGWTLPSRSPITGDEITFNNTEPIFLSVDVGDFIFNTINFHQNSLITFKSLSGIPIRFNNTQSLPSFVDIQVQNTNLIFDRAIVVKGNIQLFGGSALLSSASITLENAVQNTITDALKFDDAMFMNGSGVVDLDQWTLVGPCFFAGSLQIKTSLSKTFTSKMTLMDSVTYNVISPTTFLAGLTSSSSMAQIKVSNLLVMQGQVASQFLGSLLCQSKIVIQTDFTTKNVSIATPCEIQVDGTWNIEFSSILVENLLVTGTGTLRLTVETFLRASNMFVSSKMTLAGKSIFQPGSYHFLDTLDVSRTLYLMKNVYLKTNQVKMNSATQIINDGFWISSASVLGPDLYDMSSVLQNQGVFVSESNILKNLISIRFENFGILNLVGNSSSVLDNLETKPGSVVNLYNSTFESVNPIRIVNGSANLHGTIKTPHLYIISNTGVVRINQSLELFGNFTGLDTCTIVFQISGYTNHDRMFIRGSLLELTSLVFIRLINRFRPSLKDQFQILTFQSAQNLNPAMNLIGAPQTSAIMLVDGKVEIVFSQGSVAGSGYDCHYMGNQNILEINRFEKQKLIFLSMTTPVVSGWVGFGFNTRNSTFGFLFVAKNDQIYQLDAHNSSVIVPLRGVLDADSTKSLSIFKIGDLPYQSISILISKQTLEGQDQLYYAENYLYSNDSIIYKHDFAVGNPFRILSDKSLECTNFLQPSRIETWSPWSMAIVLALYLVIFVLCCLFYFVQPLAARGISPHLTILFLFGQLLMELRNHFYIPEFFGSQCIYFGFGYFPMQSTCFLIIFLYFLRYFSIINLNNVKSVIFKKKSQDVFAIWKVRILKAVSSIWFMLILMVSSYFVIIIMNLIAMVPNGVFECKFSTLLAIKTIHNVYLIIIYICTILSFLLDLAMNFQMIRKCEWWKYIWKSDPYYFRVQIVIFIPFMVYSLIVELYILFSTIRFIDLVQNFESIAIFNTISAAILLTIDVLFPLVVTIVTFVIVHLRRRKKGDGFVEMFNDPKLCALFEAFCIQEYSLENFAIYCDIVEFKKTRSETLALNIYAKYLNGANSVMEINISRSVTSTVFGQISRAEFLPDMFARVEQGVLTNLSDTFSRFIFTSGYVSYMNQVKLQKELIQN